MNKINKILIWTGLQLAWLTVGLVLLILFLSLVRAITLLIYTVYIFTIEYIFIYIIVCIIFSISLYFTYRLFKRIANKIEELKNK